MAISSRFVSAGALSLLVALAGAASANDPNQQQALQKAQALLKQLAQQKGLVEADLAKARADLAAKDLQLKTVQSALAGKARDLDSAEASIAAATRKASGLGSDLQSTQQRLEKTTSTLQGVVEKYKAQAARLRETTEAKAVLEAQLAKTTSELQDSEKKNLALYRLNDDLLRQYNDKSSWDALLQREPVTGIKGVEIENLLQEYADKNAEQLREINVQAVEAATPLP
jgi:chromosome segregation ATPase